MEPLSRKVASSLVKRGMKKGDFALYLTSDVTRIYPIIIGAWRVGGIVYSSYPEDTTGKTNMSPVTVTLIRHKNKQPQFRNRYAPDEDQRIKSEMDFL